jgi:hypothetical protein
MNATQLRRTIDTAVADLGYNSNHCKVNVLIRKRYFFGKRFCYEGIRAIWFAEKGIVRLLGDDGQLLATLMVAEEPVVMKRAA